MMFSPNHDQMVRSASVVAVVALHICLRRVRTYVDLAGRIRTGRLKQWNVERGSSYHRMPRIHLTSRTHCVDSSNSNNDTLTPA